MADPESKYKSVFSPSQYPKAILNLETIICSYMLKDLIKQTLRLNAYETITLKQNIVIAFVNLIDFQ